MCSEEILSLSDEGRRNIESMQLTQMEAVALIGASKKSLKSDLTKNTKLTRAVLAETLEKILPFCKQLFKPVEPNEGTPEEEVAAARTEIEKENEKSFLAAVVGKKTTEQTSKDSSNDSNKKAVEADKQEKPVCQYFLVGKCKYDKEGVAKCPFKHPEVCQAFDKRGPSGCKDKECPKGLHRKICEKLIIGECARNPNKCGYFHPSKLRKKRRAEKKKGSEADESIWWKSMVDELKNYSNSPLPIMQFGMLYPVITFMALPPPTKAKGGKDR